MATITKKDVFDAFSEFYGKVIEPRFDRIEMRLDEHDQKFRDILQHFDEIYKRFERLGRNVPRNVAIAIDEGHIWKDNTLPGSSTNLDGNF